MNPNRNLSSRYGIAFVSVLVAFLVFKGLGWLVGGELPTFITFYPAIMLIALLSGVGPGIAVTVIAALIADFWILSPVGHFSTTPRDLVSVAFFIGIGVLMAQVAGMFRRRSSELESLNSQLAMEVVEQRLAKQSLQESETRYRAVVEDQSELITRYRPDGTYTFVNEAFCRYFCKTKEEIVGSHWHPDAVAEDIPIIEEKLKLLSLENPVVVIENRVISGRGEICWMQFVNRGLFDAQGRLVESQAVGRDITEIKNLEAVLRESELRYASLFANKISAISHCQIITDEKGLPVDYRILRINDAYEHIVGIKKSDIEGRSAREVFPGIENFAFDYIGVLGKIALEGGETSYESFVEPVQKYLSTYVYSPIYGEFTTICTDITERRRADEALHQSEQRFRNLFIHAPVGIALVDALTWQIQEANPRYAEIAGIPMEKIAELDWTSITHPDDLQVNLQYLALMDAGKINDFTIKKRYIRPDGSYVWVNVIVNRIISGGTGGLQNLCTMEDITEKVHSEQEAVKTQANMIQTDKMASLGLLVSGMAHEINNPNNCILFNAELLTRTWNSAVPILEGFYRENGDFKLGSFKFSEASTIIPQLFSGLVDGAERIRNLVDMLKDFARQDNGDKFASFDTGKVITNAITILNHEIKKRCNRFYLGIAPDVPPAFGNAQQVEQVMINILLNSLQSLRDANCAIRVDTALAADGEHIVITVADEGEGMSAEVLKRLTEPFFTTKGTCGGTGLGLSIVNTILQKNHGTISFVSAPGNGTTAKVGLRVFTAIPTPI